MPTVTVDGCPGESPEMVIRSLDGPSRADDRTPALALRDQVHIGS